MRLGRRAIAPLDVGDGVRERLVDEQQRHVDDDLERAGVWRRHERRDVECGLPDMLGVPLRTMGRGSADDPAFFLAAAAAGYVAAELL